MTPEQAAEMIDLLRWILTFAASTTFIAAFRLGMEWAR